METLKKDYDHVSDMLKEKEEIFRKEKGEIIAQKDAERKKAIQEVQDQCERDYKQLTADHHDTLTQNLKAAREQHTKEKVGIYTYLSIELSFCNLYGPMKDIALQANIILQARAM